MGEWMTTRAPGLAFFLLMTLTGCGQEKPAEHLPRVLVREATTTDYAARPSVVGDIQARVEAQQAFRVGGKIIERNAEVGDVVKAGQVLARLDPQDLRTQVQNARAAVSAEQARLRLAQVGFERQAQLLPKGYTSRSEYDRAQAELRSAQSSLEAARAQLASANDQLSYTELKASADGVITQRSGEVGQVVQATMPIFTLARDGERDAVFNVYESLFQNPQGDRVVSVYLLSNPKVRVDGRVREVTPTVDSRSGTLKVKVGLDAVPAEMTLGSVVNASVAAPAQHSVVLPWSALSKLGSQPAVWLLDQERKARLQPVRVARYASEKVVIASGLEAGQTVVTVGGQLLHPGQVVEVAQPPQPTQTTASRDALGGGQP